MFGNLIYDSGSDFEDITAEAIPDFFNTTNDENAFDNRSDDRGPEPEPLDIGRVGGKTYAFIGFERISGIVAYDITNPRRPVFQQYINNRNFAIDPDAVCESEEPQSEDCQATGDLEVEGVLFISESESPTDEPLLVVIHEASNSVTLYGIDEVESNDISLEDEDEYELNEELSLMGIQQLEALHAQAGISANEILSHAVPNPFTSEVGLQFYLEDNSSVKINIFNSIGQQVRAIWNAEMFQGENEILWDGKDSNGNEVTPGVYIYQIHTSNGIYSNKIIKSE